jgi:hypothetical protein
MRKQSPGMDRTRAHPDEHVRITDRRQVDIGGFEHLGRPGPVLDDRPHRGFPVGRVSQAEACAVPLRSLL